MSGNGYATIYDERANTKIPPFPRETNVLNLILSTSDGGQIRYNFVGNLYTSYYSTATRGRLYWSKFIIKAACCCFLINTCGSVKASGCITIFKTGKN